jgi:hypothetical protein
MRGRARRDQAGAVRQSGHGQAARHWISWSERAVLVAAVRWVLVGRGNGEVEEEDKEE